MGGASSGGTAGPAGVKGKFAQLFRRARLRAYSESQVTRGTYGANRVGRTVGAGKTPLQGRYDSKYRKR